jgi:hypothetical protein
MRLFFWLFLHTFKQNRYEFRKQYIKSFLRRQIAE